MSEYQYYEFQAVAKLLTQKEMAELRSYSSRAQITPSSFINVYNWGSFKGNPKKWMEKYFDSFLYLANWGSRWLMLRLPVRLIEPDTISPYCTKNCLSYRIHGDDIIISFYSEEEDYEWTEGEGWLASLLPLRADLMHGDNRCLYLGWLLGAQRSELEKEALEPPVPPGLRDLNAPLYRFADFLRIDRDLIDAAAGQSEEGLTFELSKKDITRWLSCLSVEDRNSVLTRLLEGKDPYVAAEFRQRAIREIRGFTGSGSHNRNSNRRSVGTLLACAEEIAGKRRRREAEQLAREKARCERERATKRKKHLQSLVCKEDALWAEVDKLIATRQPRCYDEAVSILQDLRDLADMQGSTFEFSVRLGTLCSAQIKKPSLVKRLRKANLVNQRDID
jgi:hypothetical protein